MNETHDLAEEDAVDLAHKGVADVLARLRDGDSNLAVQGGQSLQQTLRGHGRDAP